MRTLFAKTLLWFVGTATFAMGAILVVSALSFNTPGRRQPPFGMLVGLQLAEAQHAYEMGGAKTLKETLGRFQSITHAESFLTDGAGRDLVTGEDRSDLIRNTAPRPRFPLFRRNRAAIARQSADGAYWYFMLTNGGIWWNWFVQPLHHLLVLSFTILLCYGFARHLTKPVRELQVAVDRFGSGDLSARVGSKRKDELGQLARTFDKMADRTQTLLTAERRLLMDISHELRSPLARLSVAVELARSGDAGEYLSRIQKEADRLNALVGELLQVTRAEGDPSQRKLEPVRLDEVVMEVADDCAIEAQARGSKLDVHAAEPVTLPGDRELLRRAVENVLRNAIRHAPADTTVEVELRKDGTVTVRDYGPGVPEEALPRIFDPFYRVETDRNRTSGGVGLGLAIARRAVELHQGRIWARNAGPGLLVEMNLPLGA